MIEIFSLSEPQGQIIHWEKENHRILGKHHNSIETVFYPVRGAGILHFMSVRIVTHTSKIP